jgi:hypothetical protein
MSRFTEIFVTLKSLPRIKTTAIIYATGLFGYNIFGTYVDSKIILKKYRENNLHELGIFRDDIRSDWQAVKYGANYYAINRLWNSIIWPITSITNIIPEIVLLLNPSPPPEKSDYTDRKEK